MEAETTEEQEVLPCPFCGGDDLVPVKHDTLGNEQRADWKDAARIICNRCGMMGPADGGRSLRKAWNARQHDPGSSSPVAASCVGAYSFEHECKKILDFDVGEGEDRDVWVGEITDIADDLPDEDWCLHIQTPEKPEIVFGLVHADLVCLTGIIRGILGHVPDNPIAERIAERAREA